MNYKVTRTADREWTIKADSPIDDDDLEPILDSELYEDMEIGETIEIEYE